MMIMLCCLEGTLHEGLTLIQGSGWQECGHDLL
jgi:hypothetical protein